MPPPKEDTESGLDNPPDDELAYHEAGHAVISTLLGCPPDYVTITPEGTAAGASVHTGGYQIVRCPNLLDQMIVSYAGYAAQVKYNPGSEARASLGSRNDFEQAESCVRRLAIDSTQAELLKKNKRAEAAHSVQDNWLTIQRLADVLVSERRIEKARLLELMEYRTAN